MTAVRQESDLLGPRDVPAEALYGVHTVRAMENFPLSGRRVHPRLIHAYGMVKLACARTNHELGAWDAARFAAFGASLPGDDRRQSRRVDRRRCAAGRRRHVDQHERQRGAGQSGPANPRPPLGDYATLNPLDDVNLHQSTNDTYPTALKRGRDLRPAGVTAKVVALMEAFQQKEKGVRRRGEDRPHRAAGRRAHDAGPRDGGLRRGLFNRDRWRIYKCEERLRVVNLGGTAIGTG
jgi:aspartate ammonia-lyase